MNIHSFHLGIITPSCARVLWEQGIVSWESEMPKCGHGLQAHCQLVLSWWRGSRMHSHWVTVRGGQTIYVWLQWAGLLVWQNNLFMWKIKPDEIHSCLLIASYNLFCAEAIPQIVFPLWPYMSSYDVSFKTLSVAFKLKFVCIWTNFGILVCIQLSVQIYNPSIKLQSCAWWGEKTCLTFGTKVHTERQSLSLTCHWGITGKGKQQMSYRDSVISRPQVSFGTRRQIVSSVCQSIAATVLDPQQHNTQQLWNQAVGKIKWWTREKTAPVERDPGEG